MEDPWGDPWAADAAPVMAELAPAATAASFEPPDEPLGGRPGAAAASPWEEDSDAWRDAEARTGTDVSLRLKPSASVFEHQTLPDPWANAPPALDAGAPFEIRDSDPGPTTHDDKMRAHDLEARPASLRHPLADPLDTNAKDLWIAKEPVVIADREMTLEPADEEPPPSPGSPDALPRRAIGAKRGQEASWQLSRVQGLVEMFDGIAKRNMSPTATAGREAAAREDLGPGSALGPGENKPPRSEHLAETSPNSLARVSTEEARDDRAQSNGEVETTAALGEGQEEVSRGRERSRHIDYPVDMSYLDDLFPSVSAQLPEPSRDPTTLRNDLFTSVSERKAWYRISRFGSMRCHNQGDPDDYLRVGWTASCVRERTMELVRRWMEQDSLGGRVVLGRRVGLGGGSMFNWDSADAPVEIKELLRSRGERKTPEAHWKRVSAAAGEASTTSARGSLPVAAPWPAPFGMEASEGPLVRGQEGSLAKQLANPLGASSTTPAPPVEAPTEAPAAFEGADDDDWGDMVSPTALETAYSSEAPFSGVAAVVNGRLFTRDAAQPRWGGVSRSELNGVDRSQEDAAEVNRVPPLGDDPSLGWAWAADLDLKTIKPTPARATQDREGLIRNEPSQRSRPGADHASLLHSTSSTSTDSMAAALGTGSEKESAGNDEVVARILSNLPDLSYMLR